MSEARHSGSLRDPGCQWEATKVPLALTEAVTPAAVALAAGLLVIIMIMGPQGLISGRKFKYVLLAL